MKYWIILFAGVLLTSCGSEDNTTEKKKDEATNVPTQEDDLVEIIDGHYKEYYPGKTQVKFEGDQDENKQRHGKWVYLSEKGKELSMTMYDHGKRHGHSIVRYPNGSMHYYGEYNYDTKIGVWKTYDEKGGLVSEINYGTVK